MPSFAISITSLHATQHAMALSLGQLSEEVDVFSFGVLCLQVVSGRRNIDEIRLRDEAYLSKWVRFWINPKLVLQLQLSIPSSAYELS